MAHEVLRLVLQAFQTVCTPLKDTVSYMKGKAKYVRKLGDNLTKITAELATFDSRKDQIDRKLEATVSKEKSDEYSILVTQIEVFRKRYDEYLAKYKRLFQNLPNVSSSSDLITAVQERKPTILTCKFFKLAKLSRKMSKLLDDITQITGRMKLENVFRDKKIEPVEVKHDDVDIPSFTEYVKRILSYLSEDGNRSIGIMGGIGVGKTTILKSLNNQLKEPMKFDIVIWIDCHKQRDTKDEATCTQMIQDVIMGRLKLTREEANSIEQNAKIISDFLLGKKYILLIDQVSSIIHLEEAGIHKGHKFGKVVVASSSRKVIKSMTDEQVEIQPLSKSEALGLFQEYCGTINDIRIKHIAESIVRLCGGLPLVIKLVANHLKGEKDEEVWSDVKRLMQSETKGNLQKLEGVGLAYKLVYDKLENSYKKCLLFVTLFPSDYKVYKDYLVECWNAERFLELDVPELRSARERGAASLRELTDQYLLENHSDKHVKMPQYFRKVVAEQEYPGENDGLHKIQPVTEETWRTNRWISLFRYKSKLPNNPKNDNISTLLMQCSPGLESLGDLFFSNMPKLLILDLHKTKIRSLPTSISSLVNLKCLYLNDCDLLTELPLQVQKLKKLELLDIRGTSISSLPDGMGDILHLRCLRISFGRMGCKRDGTCPQVEMTIPLHMISRLHHLEELTIEAGCCSQGWNDIADQIVSELACLEKLSTLIFHFPKVSTLQKFIAESRSLHNTDTHWGPNTLRSFNISVGCCGEMQHPYGSEVSRVSPNRRLRFSTNEDISSVIEVLRQASSFELVGHHGVGSLSDFNLKNAGTLKSCVVERCTNMMSLVVVDGAKSKEERDGAILQCLEKLHLFYLQSLKSIWRGPVSSGSLANLKYLTLFGCPELTMILNLELAKALSSLEHVKVEECSKVLEIINMYEGHNISEYVDLSNVLNKVMTIELVNLPMLESICKTTISMKWKSLMRIVVRSCNRLRDIPEKLEPLVCEESWWNAQKHLFSSSCKVIFLEQTLATGVSYEAGESSSSSEHGRSANPVASNANVSKNYNDEAVPRNGNNIHSINHGHQDLPESSSHGVECVTHQSENPNAPAKGESLSFQFQSKVGLLI